MKIGITGASGLVGTALSASLKADGHAVVPFVRTNTDADAIYWDPAEGQIDAAACEHLDGVVHLAGENVAKGRWNEAKKSRILNSRVQGTKLLAETLAACEHPPQVLVSASAIGFYGDQRPEPVNESAEAGVGFLADVCQEWEAAAEPARQAGIRTVHPRIGVVLSAKGGALHAMLTPFKLGGGGIVGDGRQVWSWISIDDLVGGIRHILENESLAGPVNLTSPHAVTNTEFTKQLGHVLGRPTILPMPAFAARLVFGEMADGLLLASSDVRPEQLLESGYQFQHEQLEAALHAVLK